MLRFRSTLAYLTATYLVETACLEDRGIAADVAAHFELIRLRDVIDCYRVAHRRYPATLRELTSASVSKECPSVTEVETTINYSQQDAPNHGWLGHRWVYVPTRPDRDGRLQEYGLSVADIRSISHYRSFWVDHTGIVRSTRGRPAGSADPPEDLQRITVETEPTPHRAVKPSASQ
jgi:hypothetical protein